MAHRDDTGTGPGANDNATGTAALVELARGYGQANTPAAQRVRPAHTIVFLSTDGGAFGGLGAARFVARKPFHVVATINLTAIGGAGRPRIVITGDAPRSPAAGLVETAAKRVLEQSGTPVRRAGFVDQLIDLGFPFTLYEQGPFVAHGIPAVTLTTAGERPPAAFTDRASLLHPGRRRRDRPLRPGARRVARPGPRAGAGDDELRLGGRPDHPRLGDRAAALRAADPLLRRRGRPLRALPAPAHPAAARGAQPAHAGRLLALPRPRVLRPRRPRRLAGRRAAPAESRQPHGRATGPCSRCSCSRRSALPRGSSRATGSSRGGRSAPTSGWRARRRRCSACASSRCSFWQQTRSLCSSCCPRCTPGCGCRRCGRAASRRAQSSSSSASSAHCSCCSRSASATSSGSTRRGTCSSWRRSAT